MIISTIKSRCKRFKKYYDIPIIKDNDNLIETLLKFKDLNYTQILETKKIILSNDKSKILDIINDFKYRLLNEFQKSNNIKELAKYYKILDNIIELIKSNVNTELCLDKMFIEMRK